MSVVANGKLRNKNSKIDPNQQIKAELQRAVNFAHMAHDGQFRKHGNLPYIVHPLAVLQQLVEWGVTEIVTLKAAPCHDIREERPDISRQKVAANIGALAAEIVEELTFLPNKNSNLSIPQQKNDYLKTFLTKSIMALVIKVADRNRNTWDFWNSDPKYAPIYWRKADSVHEAMLSREEEIKVMYGDGVFTNMKFSCDDMRRRLLVR